MAEGEACRNAREEERDMELDKFTYLAQIQKLLPLLIPFFLV